MKNAIQCALLFLMLTVSAGVLLAADPIKGTLSAVDSKSHALEVITPEGSKSVWYDNNTVWPADVVTPDSLQGKNVTIEIDETSGNAQTVALAE